MTIQNPNPLDTFEIGAFWKHRRTAAIVFVSGIVRLQNRIEVTDCSTWKTFGLEPYQLPGLYDETDDPPLTADQVGAIAEFLADCKDERPEVDPRVIHFRPVGVKQFHDRSEKTKRRNNFGRLNDAWKTER
jgi:hypothetical protein